MNIDALYRLLSRTTAQLRKGEILSGSPELVRAFKEGTLNEPPEKGGPKTGGVLTIDAMPSENDAEFDAQFEKVDCVLLTVAVHRARAEESRAEFLRLLANAPASLKIAMRDGPSYMHLGGELGDQGAAFQFMALGSVLGLWKMITPATLGVNDPEQALQMACSGFVMMGPYSQ